MKSMYAMMSDLHKKAMAEPEKKKEEEPKKDAAAPAQKKASAMKSFPWHSADQSAEPETMAMSEIPLN